MTKLPKNTLNDLTIKNKSELKNIIANWDKENFRFLVDEILKKWGDINEWLVEIKNINNFNNTYIKKIFVERYIEIIKNDLDFIDIFFLMLERGLLKNDTENINKLEKICIEKWILEKYYNDSNEDYENLVYLEKFVEKLEEDVMYIELFISMIENWLLEKDNENFNKLVEVCIEKVEINSAYGEVFISILEKWLIEKDNENININKIVEICIRKWENDFGYGELFISILEKWLLEKDTENIKEWLKICIERLDNNSNYIYVIISILGKWFSKKNNENVDIDKMAEMCIENLEDEPDYGELFISILENGLLEKDNEIINIDRITEIYIKKAKNDSIYGELFISMLDKGLIKKDNKNINKWVEICMKEPENNSIYVEIFTWILNNWLIEKDNKNINKCIEVCKKGAEYNFTYADIFYSMLKNWLIDKDTEDINQWVEICKEEAKNDVGYAEIFISMLEKWLIEKDNENINELTELYLKEVNIYPDSRIIFISMLEKWLIEKDNENIDRWLKTFMEKAENNFAYAEMFILMLEKWFLEKSNEDIQLNKEYKANYDLIDKIISHNKVNKMKSFNFLKTKVLDFDLLNEINDFLENKNDLNINGSYFLYRIEAITQNSKWLYFWYFYELIIGGGEVEENDCSKFPITLNNFTDYLDKWEILMEFVKDIGFKWSWITPWTKEWFLEEPKRKKYLSSEKFKIIRENGTVAWVGIIEWSDDSNTLKSFHEDIFLDISLNKSRNSILQLWKTFSLVLEKENYKIFNELVDNEVEIWNLFKNFILENSISDKWKTILNLLITSELNNSFVIFEDTNWEKQVDSKSIKNMLLWVYSRLEKYKPIIDTYKNVAVKTSIWIEYEVWIEVASWYKNLTWNNYIYDIETLSEYSWIAKWLDAVHEIATKPTDNPYLVLLEMQLLQDLDFIDLNFKKDDYSKWSRWLHINLWWEYWIKLDRDVYFIQNILLASNIWARNIWDLMTHEWNLYDKNEILNKRKANWIKDITDIRLDIINDFEVIRDRGSNVDVLFWIEKTAAVEYRMLNIINSENFERLILSIFNLNMAKQGFNNKWEASDIWKEYIKLKNDIRKIIINHNKNFKSDELIDEQEEKKIWKIFTLFNSTWPVIKIFKNSWIDIKYLKELVEKKIENKEKFIEILKNDWKIKDQTDRQINILFLRYKKSIKPNFEKLKSEDSKMYSNLEKYLNWNIEETDRRIINKKRFDDVIKWDLNYLKDIKINSKDFFEAITPQLFSKLIKINNLFVKKDSTNASNVLDVTRELNGDLISDSRLTQMTIFDRLDNWVETRKGYNIIQWASEKMITQAIQKRILEFNEIVFDSFEKKKSIS